ncbi:MAG: tetratricopeptide repeat protein, partial [Acidobacteriaceae bacterium]
ASCQFQAALETPYNLGEARHLLANQSDVYYWAGIALEKQGKADEARKCWLRATRFKRDFQQMTVKNISDMTYWSALAHQCLGENDQAQALLRQVYEHSLELETVEPKIDYFATSLPAMLLFEEDLRRRNAIEARYLRAQSYAGLGKVQEAELLLQEVLTMDASHAGASDLLQQIHMPKATFRAG